MAPMPDHSKIALLVLARLYVPLSVATITQESEPNPEVVFYFPFMEQNGTDFVVTLKPNGQMSIGGNGTNLMEIFDQLDGFAMNGHINEGSNTDHKNKPISQKDVRG